MTAPERRSFAGLGRRVATAAVALPLLLAVVWWGPGWLFEAVAAAAALIGFRELLGLIEAGGLRPLKAAGLLALAAAFAGAAHPETLRLPLAPLAGIVFLVALLWRAKDSASVPAAGATLLAALYLGGLTGAVAGLRLMDPAREGPARVVLLLAIVMGSDVVAYFVGHLFGRRALAPQVSPGKTVEGALGGLAGGVIGAAAVEATLFEELLLVEAALLGLVGAALGVAGDLSESLLKRWAGVKDSGGLFPGHGGMLDRLDSLLFGGAALYYYFLFLR